MSLALFAQFQLLADSQIAVQPPPTWTDKEVLVAFGRAGLALLGFAGAVLFPLYRALTGKLREHVRVLKCKLEQAEKEGGQGGPPVVVTELQALLADVNEKLADAQTQLTTLQASNGETVGKLAEREQAAKKLELDLGGAVEELQSHKQKLAVVAKRVQKALEKDGHTWTEKVLYNAPDFKPLDPEGRRVPVLSMLNLKGGVGKTTLTANLAAALAARGYRVLLLDLDLQGSLTNLFLTEAEQDQLHQQKRLIGDFLASSFGADFPNLIKGYSVEILPGTGSALVATTDRLAYAETNLTIRWLLRECNRDPRFLLRKELQMKKVTNHFDVVLLDCPPLINVCCVNALAASDYLIIPVVPSKQATDRVPVLLQRLKELKPNINPDLKVMGVVANRTARSELTYDEENRLSLLKTTCMDVWGEPVPRFDRFIRQSASVREAEDGHRPLRPDDEAFQWFAALAEEVESRLPSFCVPAGKTGPAAEVKS